MSSYLKICPNCFLQGYDGGKCANCGYTPELKADWEDYVLPVGTLLNDRYITGRVLGVGGFGITYRVCDLRTGTICAVKEYAPSMICARAIGNRMVCRITERTDSYFHGLERFEKEAMLLMSLSDIPEIIHVFDYFRENNTAYYAMELLTGVDLSTLVRKHGRFAFNEILPTILQVCGVMDRLYSDYKIIHRDLTPENIRILEDGSFKIFDFGNAKQEVKNPQETLLVKPSYAPPEQFSTTLPEGSYTDVYSIASTLFFTLTGKRLVPTNDRLNGVPYTSLYQMRLGVPKFISDAVDHALTLDYRQRTQTMRQFAEELTAENTSGPGSFMPYLEIIQGSGQGTMWRLPTDVWILIGSSPNHSNIVIPSSYGVSKKHVQVYYQSESNQFFIKDISTYGTWLEGLKMRKGISVSVNGPVNILFPDSTVIRLKTMPGGNTQ